MTPQPALLHAVLPEILQPAAGAPLVRVGRSHDGGYLVDSRNLDAADIVIGMGVNDDWSFEESFYTHRNRPVMVYDASVSAWDFFIKFYTKVALFEPINAKNALRTLLSHMRFFNKTDRVHHYEYIGTDDNDRTVSLTTILKRDVDARYRNLFFKIDIEGSEYQLLDELIACADRIEGLVIEFHDVDRNMARIKAFVEAFPLTLCHIHGNNFSPVLDDGTPIVIECSFTRQDVTGTAPVVLPHDLDEPCWCEKPEIAISFANRQT